MAIFREICWKRLVLIFFLSTLFWSCTPPYSYEGERTYTVYCQPCHGVTGNKSVGGAANLQNLSWNEEVWKSTVMQGIPNKMPAFDQRINDKDWQALKEYLLYINEN